MRTNKALYDFHIHHHCHLDGSVTDTFADESAAQDKLSTIPPELRLTTKDQPLLGENGWFVHYFPRPLQEGEMLFAEGTAQIEFAGWVGGVPKYQLRVVTRNRSVNIDRLVQYYDTFSKCMELLPFWSNAEDC